MRMEYSCWDVVKEDLLKTIKDFVLTDFLDYVAMPLTFLLFQRRGQLQFETIDQLYIEIS